MENIKERGDQMADQFFRGLGGRIIQPYQYVQRFVGDLLHVEKRYLSNGKGMVKALDLNDPLQRIVDVEASQLAVVSEGSIPFLNEPCFF